MTNHYKQLLPQLIAIAKEAGKGIMTYYRNHDKPLNVSEKSDHTLLTEADLCADRIVKAGLSALDPKIPLISEEGDIPAFEVRHGWPMYWLADPLDGTRGFVERRDDFTVNIALIENDLPIIGVMYTPVKGITYYAVQGEGAFKQHNHYSPQPLKTRALSWEHVRILMGHYLHTKKLPDIFNQYGQCEVIHMNSSLKFGWIAEGQADLYLRLGKTSEWDTAAAQCILTEAGGLVIDLDGNPLRYNTKDSLVNPFFVAIGDHTQKKSILNIINQQRRES